jgi:hypothetical protein
MLLGACLACTVLMLSVSGCVDIYGARGIFGGKAPPAPVVYRERLKAEVSHDFETKVVDPGSWTFSGSDSAVVKKGTRWLSILIEITMLDTGAMPIDIPLLKRYVHVQVSGADGSMQWDSTNYITTHDSATLQSPLDGPWSIHVDAVGYGIPDYGIADSFKVMMSVSEPG